MPLSTMNEGHGNHRNQPQSSPNEELQYPSYSTYQPSIPDQANSYSSMRDAPITPQYPENPQTMSGHSRNIDITRQRSTGSRANISSQASSMSRSSTNEYEGTEEDVVPGDVPVQETQRGDHPYEEVDDLKKGGEAMYDYPKGSTSQPRHPRQATTMPLPGHPMMHQAGAPSSLPGNIANAAGNGNVNVYNICGHVGKVVIGTHGHPTKAPPAQPGKAGEKKKTPQRTPPKSTKTKKLLVPKRSLRSDDMDFLADHIGNNWRQVGRKLSFSNGQLDIIENDNRGLHEQIFAMLQQWGNSKEEATVKEIVKVLLDSGCVDVAKRLSDRSVHEDK